MDSKVRARGLATVVFGVLGLFAVGCGSSGASEVARAQAPLTGCTASPTFAGLGTVTNDAATTCGTHLTWSAATANCGGAITYSVYRGATAGFVPSRANRIATGLTSTDYADGAALSNNGTYWYVVRATETATREIEEPNSLARSATVGGAAPQTYFDDFDSNRPENASEYWRASASSVRIVDGCRFQSATHAYRFGDSSGVCGGYYPPESATLTLGGDGTAGINGFSIPANATRALLAFHLWSQVEGGFDFVNLGTSTSGPGGTYTVAHTWTGDDSKPNGSLTPFSLDVTSLKGQTVWFRWDFLSDAIVQYEGYYVDDVRFEIDFPATCTRYEPPPQPPASFELTGMPSSVMAGAQVALTVRAVDAYGRTASTYAGVATGSSSDPQATVDSQVIFTDGLATTHAVFRRAGARSLVLSATEGPTVQGAASTSVAPGAASQLSILTQPTSITAGATFGEPVQISVGDAFGNPVASASADITVALDGNPTGDALGGTLTRATVNGVATFPELSLTRAGSGYTLAASASGWEPVSSAAFDVLAAAPTALRWTVQPSTARARAPFAPAPAVQLVDAYGNAVATEAQVSVSLSSDGSALQGDLDEVLSTGTATFSNLFVASPGSGYTLTATSSGVAPIASEPFDVLPSGARLDVVLATPVKQGQPVSVTVTSRDGSEAVAKDNLRTVVFTSSDAKAQLPAPVALYDGRAQATVVFGSSGSQTLTATISDDATITGTQSATVAAVDTPSVTLLTPNDGATVTGTVLVIASATAGEGTSVASLSILVDGTPIQTGTTGTLSASWDTTTVDANTPHVLTAKVVDVAGNTATSAPVTVAVTLPAARSCGCGTGGGAEASAYGLALVLLQFARRRLQSRR